jgi:hypothetical protein
MEVRHPIQKVCKRKNLTYNIVISINYPAQTYFGEYFARTFLSKPFSWQSGTKKIYGDQCDRLPLLVLARGVSLIGIRAGICSVLEQSFHAIKFSNCQQCKIASVHCKIINTREIACSQSNIVKNVASCLAL